MANLRQWLTILFFLFFFHFCANAQTSYRLFVKCIDKDEKFLSEHLKIETKFSSQNLCINYVNQLASNLQTKGFVTTSVDSFILDSTSAKLVLYVGDLYKFTNIKIDSSATSIMKIIGWDKKRANEKPWNFFEIENLQESVIHYLENNGHPFAKIYLDSFQLQDQSAMAQLKLEKGPLYKIDSIRVFGKTVISNSFLQKHLGIVSGSLYNSEKIASISKKIKELSFLEEIQVPDVSLLATGSVVNLYLQPKRSNQFNLLVGIAPNQEQQNVKKIKLTGEANILLRNALGVGETIGFNWQQLQQKSPRLNFFYQHPYFLKSNTGIAINFDMIRKDSSYLNINLNAGSQYFISKNETGKIFLQNNQTIISEGGIKSAQVIATKQLPDVMDLSVVAVGFEFEKNKTNYRPNPQNGYEFVINGSAGVKRNKKNQQILSLKDPSNPNFKFETLYDAIKLKSYQFKIVAAAAKYFPIKKQSVLKTAINSAVYFSDNIFRNELFHIGGYKLMRGFSEESEYVSQYTISTLEYRYLIGINAFFYGFADFGFGKNASIAANEKHSYFGTGLGLAFETKAGILNLSWAVGKRDDTKIDFKQSKIHFGFVNYF